MIDNIYIIVPENEITNRLINISTSRKISDMPITKDGDRVLEILKKYQDYVLDYRWLTSSEVMEAVTSEEI